MNGFRPRPGSLAERPGRFSFRGIEPPDALIARYGGEEFACLLPGYGAENGMRIAERMRLEMERRAIPVPGCSVAGHATVSPGVAAADLATDADVHQLLRQADAALYRAKSDGRNCVRL